MVWGDRFVITPSEFLSEKWTFYPALVIEELGSWVSGGRLSEDSGIEISYSSATISVNCEKL